VSNAGTITSLSNSGTIEGGVGGKGSPNGAAGDAVYSAGANASIGPITNTGKIISSVEIDNQGGAPSPVEPARLSAVGPAARSRSETAASPSPPAIRRSATISRSMAAPGA
jgi:hypothetical protein